MTSSRAASPVRGCRPAGAVPGPAALHERPRIPALDGVRGLAILGVLVAHATIFTTRTDFSALDRLVLAAGTFAGSGVDLFFVLSGCLITGILLDSRDSERYFSTFYRRRALRIFPLYYAVLLFVLLVLPRIAPDDGRTARELAAQSPMWFFLYGYNVLATLRDAWQPGILGHTWSLALEEQFYLLWPLVVRAVPPPRLAWIVPVVVALGVGSRVVIAAAGGSGLLLRVFPLARLDCFAIGALVALALRGHARVAVRRLPPLLLAAAALLMFPRILGWRGSVAHATCDVLAFGLVYGAVVMLAAASAPGAPASRALSWRPLRILGKYSYALYLVHPLAWFTLRPPLESLLAPLGLTPTLSWGVNLVVLGGASLAVAFATWHGLEKRFLALRERSSVGRREPPDVSLVPLSRTGSPADT